MAHSSPALTEAPPAFSTVTAPARRVLSIDVLRGLTMAFMILVNDAGDSHHTYVQLEHAAWNGWTLTDLVFPTFLFVVGMSIILSINARLQRGASKRDLALHTFRRAGLIYLVYTFIALYPHFNVTHFRFYGVLPRIAICYLIVGLICLATQSARTLLSIAAVLLVAYWVMMRFVPVPGFGVPTVDIPLLDKDANLVAWLDRGIIGFLQRTIHTGRLYEGTRDPEGLLSTIPAIATPLIGAVAALWLRRAEGKSPLITRAQCAWGFVVAGIAGISSGLIWNIWFPINKKLWTSSYVLFAAGCTLLGLALCYWLIDIKHFNETKLGEKLTWPFFVFGSNAIVAYAVSDLVVETFGSIHTSAIGANGKPMSVLSWIYWHIFASNGSTNNTSLAFALAYVLVCFIPNWILWRKKIFVKL
ncbi:MAG TPA: heparan-alpha-glucosaminide N-acetyltransferase domain-containing protein [Edaphobacter sp.]